MNWNYPITIGDIVVPSKVFFAPINPGWCEQGIASEKYFDFFEQRSGKAIGICYIGNVAIHNEWGSNDNTACLWETESKAWINVVEQIRSNGSIPAIQLAWKSPSIPAQKDFIANDKNYQLAEYKLFYEKFAEFEEVKSLYVNSIRHAYELGFPIVQIHAAHGYAMSLLLSREISGNDNPTETKGIKLIREIVESLGEKKPILDIRLSFYEGINDDISEKTYKQELISLLIDLGFSIISISNGLYNIDKTMIYPPKEDSILLIDDIVALAETNPSVVWNVSGNMENLFLSTIALPENVTISLGRQLIVDPSTLQKIKNDTLDEIKVCTECKRCHYYSYGFKGIMECVL